MTSIMITLKINMAKTKDIYEDVSKDIEMFDLCNFHVNQNIMTIQKN